MRALSLALLLAAQFVLAGIVLAGAAVAETFKVEAVLAPQEHMKLEFQDGSKHFVLLVRREGKAEGTGPFAGAAVMEYGMHDIIRGVGGEPRGYLEIATTSGDIAYLKWQVRAVFFKGEGKPRLADNGYWELAGGTGQFEGQRGLGTLVIKAASKTDRLFIIEGELAPAP